MAAEDIPTSALLKRHEELQELYGDGDAGNFISGWQCENPWSEMLQKRIAAERSKIDGSKYHYLENDDAVVEGFSSLQHDLDAVTPQSIVFGEGSSSLIFAFCAWLKERGVSEVFYVPPLYFTFHFALRSFGIKARPVAGRHPFEDGFVWNLPSAAAVLLLSDPVWYAGMPLREKLVERLVLWQRATGSLVFVDGSFQYMRWSGRVDEPTARLDPSSTIRLLCPTKSLAVHGYRFAYATIPAAWRQQFETIYANVYGSAAAENLAFARAAVAALCERRITDELMRLAAHRHRVLRASGALAAAWEPECGYFVFERLDATLPADTVLMDGSFFEQRRYPDHRRINLLSPSIGMLGENLDFRAFVELDQDAAVAADRISNTG